MMRLLTLVSAFLLGTSLIAVNSAAADMDESSIGYRFGTSLTQFKSMKSYLMPIYRRRYDQMWR